MDTNHEPLDQGQFQPVANTEYQNMVQDDLTARLRSVASWFYWVVGLSVINTLGAMTTADFSFSLGLGITQLVDGIALAFPSGKVIALVIDFIILGFFVFLGVILTRRRAAWALWVGVILYGLDTLVFLIGPQWIALALHGFVLYKLSRGFGILNEAKQVA
jgi:hypothetical protein